MAGARNNPAEPTGTAHSGVDVHVHVRVCFCNGQISTNYGIKDEVDASVVRDRCSHDDQPWKSVNAGQCENGRQECEG